MRIVYIKGTDAELEKVRGVLHEYEVIAVNEATDVEESLREGVDALCVFVDTVVDDATLALFPKLSLIATRSTGFDHIAVASCKERGIAVSHVPRYGSATVAEFTFALILALSRKIAQAHQDMREHTSVVNLEPYEGFNLRGKTLGVIGTGAIGQSVCSIAQGFGMRVLAFDEYPNEELRASEEVTYCELPLLLAESDIVTLHVPKTPQTVHMINGQTLALMKSSAILVNTARGEIVDTKELVAALRDKRIAGACLDVLEGERELKEEPELLRESNEDSEFWQQLVASHALIDMDNVIITPHIAFNTKEAKDEILDITLATLKAHAKGERLHEVPA